MPSAREVLEIRERKAWIEAEEKRVRDNEDHAEYKKYLGELRGSGITPLSFEQWRSHIPEDLKDADAVIRGVAASANSNLQRLARVAVDRIKNAALTDEELTALGFDPEDRVVIPEALSIPGIVDAFKHFAKNEPRYVTDLHYFAMSDFMVRNKLYPSDDHIRLSWSHLHDLNLLPEPPEPEAEPNPELNEFGVNVNIARDEALEARISARKRLEEYATKVIMRGPDGREYCQRDLDRLGADETLRVLRFNESLQRNL